MRQIDREKLWRKFAPAGQENAFAEAAARYRARQQHTDSILESIDKQVTWETWIDKQCRTALRMRRARKPVMLVSNYYQALAAARDIKESKYGACLQGRVGRWSP